MHPLRTGSVFFLGRSSVVRSTMNETRCNVLRVSSAGRGDRLPLSQKRQLRSQTVARCSALGLPPPATFQVYATLFPIVCGVALVSVAELSFSWASFLPAVGSNTAFALRSTFSKKAMTTPRGEARGRDRRNAGVPSTPTYTGIGCASSTLATAPARRGWGRQEAVKFAGLRLPLTEWPSLFVGARPGGVLIRTWDLSLLLNVAQ